mmetsp:Transcript_20829/g.42905  ORF Transcript_20829/g.42905 Transcript_20829/m.42905 type:complete len:84 (+) Transcript_20829:70-321(+)
MHNAFITFNHNPLRRPAHDQNQASNVEKAIENKSVENLIQMSHPPFRPPQNYTRVRERNILLSYPPPLSSFQVGMVRILWHEY